MVGGCERSAKKVGMCWGHFKRRLRNQDTDVQLTPRLSRLARLEEVALTYAEADADDDEEWRRARENLRKAANMVGGRPRKVSAKLVVELVAAVGSIQRAAQQLGISRVTAWRACRDAGAVSKRF